MHAHNDFFELLAEIGIFGAFIYFSIFVYVLIVNLKKFFKSKKSDEQMLALLALMLLVSYGVDASFNFPLYRPTMQLGFLLLLAITMINSASSKENKPIDTIKTPYTVSGIVLLVLAIVPIYVSYYSYKTMMLETKIYHDPVHKDITLKPKMTADEIINLSPKFPNILLTSTGSYEEYIGTLYYVNDDFDNALQYFRKANKINPYIGKSDFYTYYIFKKRKENDSAYHYLKSSFYRRAWSIDIYKILLKEMIKRKDTAEIFKSYRHFNDIHESPEALNLTVHALSSTQYDNKQLFTFIDKEKNKLGQLDLKVNIDSLLSKAQSDIGTRLMAQRKKEEAAQAFEKAISLDSTNYAAIQSLGLYYSGKKDFEKAIVLLKKSLKNPNLKDNGRTEFIIGLSYSAKYDLANACKCL